MKLKINYEITEFTEADADNVDSAREQARLELANLHMEIVDGIYLRRDAVLEEKAKADKARFEDERHWARFLHFCHTGVML